jgi:hypothetical protein
VHGVLHGFAAERDLADPTRASVVAQGAVIGMDMPSLARRFVLHARLLGLGTVNAGSRVHFRVVTGVFGLSGRVMAGMLVLGVSAA